MRGAASRGRCIGVTLGLAWAAGGVATVHAAAHVPPPEVRWDAPADCPVEAFTGALDRLLSGSPVDTPIHVQATVVHTADGWSIETSFDAGPERAGQRAFQASSCRTVTQAAALAIAIAVDPGVLDRWVPMTDAVPASAESGVPEPRVPEASAVEPPGSSESLPGSPEPSPGSPEPSPELGPIEAAAPTSAPRDGARPKPRWRGLVGTAGSVDGGAMPGPGLGVAAVAGVLRRGFRGEVLAGYRFATRQTSPDDPRVGGSFTRWWVGVRGCGVPRLGAVELPLCAGLDGGRTIGRGTGLRNWRRSTQPWWAALVEAGVVWPVRPWLALSARAALAVPLLRQEFTIDGLGLLHRVGPVEGRGALGVELRWP